MYQALYRKYRSQNFAEMIGQSVMATTLKQAVSSKKISHAYLFSGPRGTGKTSAAKIFAKAMNCPHEVDGEPCNQCAICQDITTGSLEDVIEIDAASNNGVDEIREIREKSTYAPSRATYKVYIIDEVHMLSTGAFNALLKTLEEPTANVVFILATTELHKIPATILSRVQRFEFKAIKQSDIETHLATILEREGLSYEREGIALIARYAEGGMRDALSILDQAISLTSEPVITLSIAEEITGSISLSALDDFVSNLLNHQTSQALDNLTTLFENGKSMSRFATDLLQYFRDLLLAQASGEVVNRSDAFHANLKIGSDRLFRMIDCVTQLIPELKQGTQSRIYAEMLTIQLSELSDLPSQTELPETVLSELSALKEEIKTLKKEIATLSQNGVANSPTQAKVKTTPFTYKVDRNKILTIMEETVADSQQSKAYLEALKEAWNEILDSISPQDRALLLGSEPVLANAENAILAFDAAFNAEQAMKRTDLNTIFANIMSEAAGFSPHIIAVPRRDFNTIRTEFATKRQSKKEVTTKEETVIPEAFDFLMDKITVVND